MVGLCRSSSSSSQPEDEEMDGACLNGGSCMEDEDEDSLFCSCSSGWSGEYCQFPLKTTELSLGSTHNARLESARTLAAIGACVLFVAAAILSTFVYFRYRRKERLLEDRLFRATAEELYRRPFNNRSSIVESLSRLNSVRRQGTNGRDNGTKGSSTLELNTQAECHSLTSELGRDFETRLIRQPSSGSRAGGAAGGAGGVTTTASGGYGRATATAPSATYTKRNELTV